ncbi:O-methyltransferase [Helicovermis profundi]|uniref:tRNA 5-hydroxyuridine methyltransferase n=1 Tax=Helicovermis profundi TaxID=3065157 RepID=A0AAU9ENS9_9FIRM|nr:O-methyltransferase [Clostridia bacterium S502]
MSLIKSEIVNPVIEEYVRSLIPKRNDYYENLHVFAKENGVPIVQPEVATFLEVIIKSSNIKKVLEIGTAIGYSTSLIADAIDDSHGKVVSIEVNEETYKLAKNNIENQDFNCPIELKFGDARDVLSKIDDKFDMIFIDAAKGHYKHFFDLCYDKLKNKGIVISDNVLYKGMIASDKYVIRRKKTIVKRMRNYLEYITSQKNLKTTIMPFGDGVAVTYKMEDENE